MSEKLFGVPKAQAFYIRLPGEKKKTSPKTSEEDKEARAIRNMIEECDLEAKQDFDLREVWEQ